MSSKPVPTVFETDNLDSIRFVNDAWVAFAIENGADQLTRGLVVGRRLWDFIEGLELRMLYQGIASRVRESGNPTELAFRCDSPDHARYMSMRVESRGKTGVLRFTSKTERIEARPRIALLDARQESRSLKTLLICSVCKAVRLEDEKWVELEEAVSKLDLASSPSLPRLSHGICPPCAQRIN